MLPVIKNKPSLSVYFVSLGCPRNLVDSEVMIALLLRSGISISETMGQADFLIVNTCGFLKEAREEGLETIASFFQERKKNAKVIAVGCMVQKEKETLRAHFPDIHALLGSGDAESILQVIQADTPLDCISDKKSYLQAGEVPRAQTTPKHYAYLKIAEGCLKRCSFCIIPQIKGNLRSKTEEQIEKEFKALLESGVHEVILIAQDLGDFGKERREKKGLHRLLRRLLSIKKDFWIRLLYLYPDEIDDELIQIMKEDPRICPYLDMPIQHINDRILKLMRRKTDRKQIISTFKKLRNEIPHIVIRTSLMCGFPSETEEEFEELVSFIQDYPLDNIGFFAFSAEKEAYAFKLPGHIAEEVKQNRVEKIAAVQQKIIEQRGKKYLGKKLDVLIDGVHPESEYLLTGRFYGQCPEIDGQVIINDFAKLDQIGALHQVEILESLGYDLVGKIIKPLKKKETKLKILI